MTAETAGNGTTTYSYNNADQVISTTTPPPGNGQPGLTTGTSYNPMLQPATVTYPDSTSMTTAYTPDGQVQQTSGSRVYPVAYTYDGQGRPKTMMTWTNFSAGSGAATTTWNYDPYRGWLISKLDNSGKGPAYTYIEHKSSGSAGETPRV
jgi:hypothetical protein